MAIDEKWRAKIRDVHRFRLQVKNGFAQETLTFYVDDVPVVEKKIGLGNTKGSASFYVDNREFEVLWLWNGLTAQPKSILLKSGDKVKTIHGNQDALKQLEPKPKTAKRLSRKIGNVPGESMKMMIGCQHGPGFSFCFVGRFRFLALGEVFPLGLRLAEPWVAGVPPRM